MYLISFNYFKVLKLYNIYSSKIVIPIRYKLAENEKKLHTAYPLSTQQHSILNYPTKNTFENSFIDITKNRAHLQTHTHTHVHTHIPNTFDTVICSFQICFVFLAARVCLIQSSIRNSYDTLLQASAPAIHLPQHISIACQLTHPSANTPSELRWWVA